MTAEDPPEQDSATQRFRRQVAGVQAAVLGSYAQIFFGRSQAVGVLLLLATAVEPRLAVAGLAAVTLALTTAHLLDLAPELIRSGLYGYNALLVGLGGAAFVEATPLSLGLFVLAVTTSVLLTATLHSALGVQLQLPSLTLPFLGVFYIVTGAIPLLDLPVRPFDSQGDLLGIALPNVIGQYLKTLGAIFFLPRLDAGVLVFAALLLYSRIATLLSILAFGLVSLFTVELFVLRDPLLYVVLGYNCILIAIALGGVWFVPSFSSFLLALFGSLMGGIFTLGAVGRLAYAGVPLLVLPFNLTVLLVLHAMRQRARDGKPKAVDFLPGSPEENLNYFRTRVARFGGRYFIRFSAPFLGQWTCTQGVAGPTSHRGPWRHALDFEVEDDEGQRFSGRGGELRDYFCYRLPVVATADGVVATVVDSIPDNPVGEMNLQENWGNLVLLYHAPGLYSLVSHLSPGTISVREGQPVRRGDKLGLCGSSGRSPAPHLHFQLQATARIGAPTLSLELHDLIFGEDGTERMDTVAVPARGTRVRNVQPEPMLLQRLRFEYGSKLCFEHEGKLEELVADIDLYGRYLLVSQSFRATLYYDLSERGFIIWDVIGDRRSVLHLIQPALSRLPFDRSLELTWIDHLPTRAFLPSPIRPLADLAAPFLPSQGTAIRYRIEQNAEGLCVHGDSERRRVGRAPAVRTEARLSTRGLECVRVSIRGRVQSAVRVFGESNTMRA